MYPPPCISYANVRNYYGPYAHCSLDKGIACAQHIQLPTQTCVRAWYECTLTSAHISKCMQTQDSLGNMKISGSQPCWHKPWLRVIGKCDDKPMSYVAALHFVRN